MKTFSQLAVTLAVLFYATVPSSAQGTFINLDFEQAQIVVVPGSPYFPTEVVRSNALPGWTTYANFTGPNTILHNNLSLGSSLVSIHDGAGYGPIMQGQYRIALQPFTGGAFLATIGQVGTIPVNAQSIRWYSAGIPAVLFAGQNLPAFHVSDATGYSIYGANLPGLAGQTGELLFRSPGVGGVWLDNIFFSAEAVPEPSTCVLITLALACAFLRRRRRAAK